MPTYRADSDYNFASTSGSRLSVTSLKRLSKDQSVASLGWAKTCKAWLDSDGALYQRQDISKPPLKDFYSIWVDPFQVVFTIWEIRPPLARVRYSFKGAHALYSDYQGFKTESDMRDVIRCRCGDRELEFIDNMLGGCINLLDRMPESTQMLVISFLNLKSVVALAQTSSHYKKLCYDDQVWADLYTYSDLKTHMTPGLMALSMNQGWRVTYIMAYRIKKSLSRTPGAATGSLML